jgi:hypothetical protein
VLECDGRSGHEPPRWHATASIGEVDTTLLLGGHDVDFRQRALTASIERAFGRRLVVQIGGGAILGGRLLVGKEAHEIEPGWLIAAGLSYRLVDESRRAPFALFTYELAVGRTQTHPRGDASSRTPLTAIDAARIGLTAGKTFGAITPFAAARLFGGPVFWSIDGASVSGGDRYHFQLATGATVRPGAGLDAFVEWAFVGERRVAIGIGASF